MIARRSLATSLLFALAACSMRKPLEWPAVLAEVRSTHPTVNHLSVTELARVLPLEHPVLLDARTREEFETSHLPGAVLAPDLDSALDVLSRAPNAPVVVYCSVGMRSSGLAEELVAHGYTSARNLEGGIFAWANAGEPLVAGDAPATRVHPYNSRWGALLAPEKRGD
jgi:rhodanese-related sulfurtransferase